MPRATIALAICVVLGFLHFTSCVRPLGTSRVDLTGGAHPLQSGGCEPFEVHLSLTTADNALTLTWSTRNPECVDCGSKVGYGLGSGATLGSSGNTSHMLQYVMGSTYTVSEDDMCSGLAQQTPFTVVMHVVQLTSLLPGWRHHYRIEGSSRVHEFQAPPARTRGHGSNAAPVSFIAYGDMGEGVERPQKCPMAAATVAAVQDEITRKPVDLILHVGDLSYADGRHRVWGSFMSSIEPLASRVPYMVSVGNHEYDFTGSTANDLSGVKDSYHPKWGNFGDDSGGECGAMVARRFSMPSHPSFNSPFWYAFDYGSVHFTMISTEHDISPGSRQYKWLEANLAGVDRCKTPWVVVGMHRPHVRHQHCMSDRSGITHYVVGTAGHVLSSVTNEQKEWLEGDVNDWGFLRLDVDGDQLSTRFIRTSTGEVEDQVTLRAQLFSPDDCRSLAH
ncbi:purple acid phosphatase [Haematococcus lacustris]|uniref:Purple acid phosphatase n=1 Tax=Haematococcus lacustris TaxID=44745 RepID=A0A699YDI0_HAELA|nr:purple acid phosphatase [Haematococcus lacustris]